MTTNQSELFNFFNYVTQVIIGYIKLTIKANQVYMHYEHVYNTYPKLLK